jgi:hypothetical protein
MAAALGPVCKYCGIAVSSKEVRLGREVVCAGCREEQSSPEAVAQRRRESTEARANRIEGQPWWLSAQAQVIVRYTDFDQLEQEIQIVGPLGWRIAQTDTTDGHVNIGRIVAFGALSVLSPLRSKGIVTVTWERSDVVQAAPSGEDPVVTLKRLKLMLDEDLIEIHEYEAKKAEILARM